MNSRIERRPQRYPSTANRATYPLAKAHPYSIHRAGRHSSRQAWAPFRCGASRKPETEALVPPATGRVIGHLTGQVIRASHRLGHLESRKALGANSRIPNDFPRLAEVRYLQAARSRMAETGVASKSRPRAQRLPRGLRPSGIHLRYPLRGRRQPNSQARVHRTTVLLSGWLDWAQDRWLP